MIVPQVGFYNRDMARPERRGVSRASVISEAKAKISTIELADWLCGPGQMRRVGQRWTAPRPDTTPETELSALCNVYKFIIEHANRNTGVPTSTKETILKCIKEVDHVDQQPG